MDIGSKFKKNPGLSLKLFFGIFLFAGIIATYFGFTILMNAISSTSWPAAQGMVTKSEVYTSRSSDSSGFSYSYGADVIYKYSVNNKEYTSNKVSFGQYSSSNPEHAENIVNKYPKSSKVLVYYSPEDPSISILETGKSWSNYLVLGLGVLFIIIGLSGVFYKIKPEQINDPENSNTMQEKTNTSRKTFSSAKRPVPGKDKLEPDLGYK